MSAASSDDDVELWQGPEYPNYGEAIRGFGGVAAPLLAGFSLSAIAGLVTTSKPPPLRDGAVAGFAIAMGFLVFAIQYSFLASSYWVKPSDLLDWAPEATTDISYAQLQLQRKRQRKLLELFDVHQRVAGFCYESGITAFLLSVGLLLIPHRHDWTAGRIAAVVAAGAALLVELLWISGSFFGNVTRSVMMPAARKKHQQPIDLPPADPGTAQGLMTTRQADDEEVLPTQSALSALFRPYLSSVWSIGPVRSTSAAAFVVDAGWLATATHALDHTPSTDNIEIHSSTGERIGARVIFSDDRWGVTILHANTDVGPTLELNPITGTFPGMPEYVILHSDGNVETGTLVGGTWYGEFSYPDELNIRPRASGLNSPGVPALDVSGKAMGMRTGRVENDGTPIFLSAGRLQWALERAKQMPADHDDEG